jgi:hypothetical protein
MSNIQHPISNIQVQAVICPCNDLVGVILGHWVLDIGHFQITGFARTIADATKASVPSTRYNVSERARTS